MWDLTFLVVEFAALLVIVKLAEKPPDVLQFIALVLGGIAMLVYVWADVVAISGEERVWPIRLIASRVEHTAFLIYLFRQAWIKADLCRLVKSSH